MGHDIYQLMEDERANAIFWAIFDKTGDGSFRPKRDGHIARDAIAEIAALGYSESDAKEFLSENFSCCDPAED